MQKFVYKDEKETITILYSLESCFSDYLPLKKVNKTR